MTQTVNKRRSCFRREISSFAKFSCSQSIGIQVSPFGGPLSAENDVGGVIGGLMFGDAVAERRQIDPGEHRFALPEHDRG